LPDDPAGYAERIYATLHSLDDAGATDIVIENVPDDPAWAGLRDRLTRASR
jgi:L-threonylcarbamoyladenylate synthase